MPQFELNISVISMIVEKSYSNIIGVLSLQCAMLITVWLDVPIARQLIGFIFFTFIPGYVLVRLLKLNNLDRLETVLFSIGLSIAFLMLFGLFINDLLFLVGVSRPLSIEFLMIGINSFVAICVVLIYLRNECVPFKYKISFKSVLVLLLMCLPILSIIGAEWVNIYGSNVILLFLIVTISILVIFISFSKKLIPVEAYPFVVLIIAISLLYSSSLISNHIVSFGSDVPGEYFVSRITQAAAHWRSTPLLVSTELYGRLNSMLSITILPTIYSTLLNLNSTWLFKLLFPAIFSFVPLCLYKLWEPNIGKKNAFIVAFLFMAQSEFYGELLGLNRQIIAEIFFALLLIVIFSKKIKPLGVITCFSIFSFGLIVSHYGIAEIFLMFFSIASIYMLATKKRSRSVTISMLILFSSIMLSWYIYTSSGSVFDSFISFGNSVVQQLNQFFDPASRGSGVLLGLGLTTSPTIWNSIGRIFAYMTEILIALGFVGLITKRIREKFSKEQIVFLTTAILLLALLILVPGLANTLGIGRFYHISLFFLAPLLVLGAEFLISLVFKQAKLKKKLVAILLIATLIPYFFFQSGFVYEVTGSQSYSLALGKNSMSQSFVRWVYGYFSEEEVQGALWMSRNVNFKNTTIYADLASTNALLHYYIYSNYINELSNATSFSSNSVIYLNKANLAEEVAIGSSYDWNITNIAPVLNFANHVYSTDGCEIYINP